MDPQHRRVNVGLKLKLLVMPVSILGRISGVNRTLFFIKFNEL